MKSTELTLLTTLAGCCPIERIQANLDAKTTPSVRKRHQKLHAHLLSGKHLKDADMARTLYGKSRSGSHGPYKQLKDDFAWAALRAVLQTNGTYQTNPLREDQLLRCERMQALLSLMLNDVPAVEAKAWQRLLRMAEDCEHTTVSMACVRELMRVHGYRNPDELALNALSERLAELGLQLEAEAHCRDAALRLRSAAAGGGRVDLRIDGIEAHVRQFPRHDVQYYGLEAIASVHLSAREYDCVHLTVQKALSFFAQRFPHEHQPRQHFLYLGLLADLARGQVASGLTIVDELFTNYGERRLRPQQVKVLETGILLLLRAKEPAAATELLERLEAIGGVSVLSRRDKGRWLVYLKALQAFAPPEPDPDWEAAVASALRRLRWGGKQPPLCADDRYTFSILEVIRLVRNGQYRKAAHLTAQLAEALLKKRINPPDPAYRRYVFIQWLLITAKANFHHVLAPRKSAAKAKVLAKTQAGIEVDQLEFEPVLFEDIMVFINAHLAKRSPDKPYLSARV